MSDKEQLKPIPVFSPRDNPVLFYIRCLFDLQLKTIVDFLRPELSNILNNILDIGAGNSPWKSFLPNDIEYVGLDIKNAGDFNMRENNEVIYYSGGIFPFTENTFSNALCSEVLEHVSDTETFLSEIYRCLEPNGKIILTVPWSARRHHLPNDYFRFTPEALELLFTKKGFIEIEIAERGNDFAMIFNKIFVLIHGLFFPKKKITLVLTLPISVMLLPSLLIFFIAAHLTMKLKVGSRIDPLGYALTAKKSPLPTLDSTDFTN
ncbi:MAG: class I SAM-dependent methyltransferase [Methylococcales bacterium]|nr:class I SAM-dependent methyltransferase [Methylococcales bacterium]